MAYSEGQLNGGADYRVGINIWLVSQNQGGNYSTFYWEVTLVRGSDGFAWSGGNQYWSASVGGQGRSGTFVLAQNQSTVGVRVIGNGYVDVGHDGEGHRPGFANNAYIDTNHSNVGDGGSGDAWVDAPRIPKPPSAVRNLRVEAITQNSAGVRYDGPADWRGSTPAGQPYGARWHEINGTTNPVVWEDYGSQGYTSPGGGQYGPVLKPNQVYHVYVWPRSNVGDGPAAGIALTTLSGIFVSDGSKWVATSFQSSDGGSWASPTGTISDGDSWELPIPQ